MAATDGQHATAAAGPSDSSSGNNASGSGTSTAGTAATREFSRSSFVISPVHSSLGPSHFLFPFQAWIDLSRSSKQAPPPLSNRPPRNNWVRLPLCEYVARITLPSPRAPSAAMAKAKAQPKARWTRSHWSSSKMRQRQQLRHPTSS